MVKLVDVTDQLVAENLVKTFVFSEKMRNGLRAVIIKNLITEPTYETKGIQVVGSYGTGKSHLMSLVSSIAENAHLVKHIQNEEVEKDLLSIAGKYKVLRFEIGTDRLFRRILSFFAQIERYLKRCKIINLTLVHLTVGKVLIQRMMAEFEAKYPQQHFLIVIDELLEYLKGRNPE